MLIWWHDEGNTNWSSSCIIVRHKQSKTKSTYHIDNVNKSHDWYILIYRHSLLRRTKIWDAEWQWWCWIGEWNGRCRSRRVLVFWWKIGECDAVIYEVQADRWWNCGGLCGRGRCGLRCYGARYNCWSVFDWVCIRNEVSLFDLLRGVFVVTSHPLLFGGRPTSIWRATFILDGRRGFAPFSATISSSIPDILPSTIHFIYDDAAQHQHRRIGASQSEKLGNTKTRGEGAPKNLLRWKLKEKHPVTISLDLDSGDWLKKGRSEECKAIINQAKRPCPPAKQCIIQVSNPQSERQSI